MGDVLVMLHRFVLFKTSLNTKKRSLIVGWDFKSHQNRINKCHNSPFPPLLLLAVFGNPYIILTDNIYCLYFSQQFHSYSRNNNIKKALARQHVTAVAVGIYEFHVQSAKMYIYWPPYYLHFASICLPNCINSSWHSFNMVKILVHVAMQMLKNFPCTSMG